MKFIFKNAVTVGSFLLASCGVAHGVPITWTDAAGSAGTHISARNSYSYQHNIGDGLAGYRPGVDSISSASLSIWLYDDSLLGDVPFFGDGEETVGFRFDGGSWTSSRSVDSIFWSLDQFDFTVTSLLADGLLNVVIRANSGDFRFGGSLLTAHGDRSTSVPEPGTLGLLGLGLLATGLAKRRRPV